MAITVSNIYRGTVGNRKYYRAVLTQDASVAAQSIYCGFVPECVTLLRTDVSGNYYEAFQTSAPGSASPAATTVQWVPAGTQTLVASNGCTLLTGGEAAPAAAAAGQDALPTQAGGFTLGTAMLTASSTLLVIAES